MLTRGLYAAGANPLIHAAAAAGGFPGGLATGAAASMLPAHTTALPVGSQQGPLDLSNKGTSSRGSSPSSVSSTTSNSPRKTTSVTEFMHSQGMYKIMD